MLVRSCLIPAGVLAADPVAALEAREDKPVTQAINGATLYGSVRARWRGYHSTPLPTTTSNCTQSEIPIVLRASQRARLAREVSSSARIAMSFGALDS